MDNCYMRICEQRLKLHIIKDEKSLKSFVISYILCTFVPDNEPLKQAGGSESGVL